MTDKPKGLAKLLQPDEALAGIIGPDPIPRPQIMTKLWDYIKAHGLKSADDGRVILPDETMARVYGSEPFSMLKLAGGISAHVKDA